MEEQRHESKKVKKEEEFELIGGSEYDKNVHQVIVQNHLEDFCLIKPQPIYGFETRKIIVVGEVSYGKVRAISN